MHRRMKTQPVKKGSFGGVVLARAESPDLRGNDLDDEDTYSTDKEDHPSQQEDTPEEDIPLAERRRRLQSVNGRKQVSRLSLDGCHGSAELPSIHSFFFLSVSCCSACQGKLFGGEGGPKM